VEYCGKIDGQIHLCGISLGGIIGLNYALDFPEKVKTLVLIGTFTDLFNFAHHYFHFDTGIFAVLHTSYIGLTRNTFKYCYVSILKMLRVSSIVLVPFPPQICYYNHT